jgi:hypothetical protein
MSNETSREPSGVVDGERILEPALGRHNVRLVTSILRRSGPGTWIDRPGSLFRMLDGRPAITIALKRSVVMETGYA